ncbi:TetR/AcrR family transcriptional regulator [Pseudomonas umsongensis]|uniref:TetR/AcrR family transcriptional regulator n=1 Tax=Pseudomonas umsongensis TaxID=198618 RepID=UPI0012448F2E|nr:TetR/AcrR family transcriptional regulator [Pseudomonas umsongensis]QFG29381.1 TetR/AcrR family transcriptional regulator [Pseudomonas umsongensis]
MKSVATPDVALLAQNEVQSLKPKVRKMTQKTVKTKEQIIEGALACLIADGVAGATTRKIAAQAGVPLAALHYHFSSKESLLFAVLEGLAKKLKDAISAEAAPSKNLAQCIERVLLADWSIAQKNREIQTVQYELTLFALRTKEADWLAKGQYEDYLSAHEQVFSQYIDTNDAAAVERIRDLSQLALTGIDGIILLELAAPDAQRSQSAVRNLISSLQKTYG